jgi:pimeloyl-ACP methyl ester carboxylesterase
MSNVLDRVAATASQYDFDLKKVIARGISTGGYFAFRIAHTHTDRAFVLFQAAFRKSQLGRRRQLTIRRCR